jgi:hypothetical protein
MAVLVAFVLEDDGKVIWSGPAISREIDARKTAGSRLPPGANCAHRSEDQPGGSQDS